jgi:hypothetical protein
VPVRGFDPATPTSAFCDLFLAELSQEPLKNGFAAREPFFSGYTKLSLLYMRNLPALTGGFKEFPSGPADSTCLPESKDLHKHSKRTYEFVKREKHDKSAGPALRQPIQ